jgi:LemA protein
MFCSGRVPGTVPATPAAPANFRPAPGPRRNRSNTKDQESTDMAGTIAWVVTGVVIAGLALYVIGVYNSVVRFVREIHRNFGNLETILKQRHDEIPKLVNACQAYMQHERGLLEDLTRLRTGYEAAATPEAKIRIENQLNQRMQNLRHVWEAYPQLRANEQFLQVHGRISTLETTINDQRQLFNDSVTQYNIFVAEFPTLLVAKLFGYLEKPLLEIPEEDQKDNLAPFPLKAA